LAKALLTAHTPGPNASVRITLLPTHTEEVSGDIGPEATTLTVAWETQAPSVYLTMSKPAVTPVTTPAVPDTEALPVVVLHVPPTVPTERTSVNPVHTGKNDGVTGEEIVLTVTEVVATAELQVAIVATTEYVPVAAVVTPAIDGFWSVDVKLAGPVQE